MTPKDIAKVVLDNGFAKLGGQTPHTAVIPIKEEEIVPKPKKSAPPSRTVKPTDDEVVVVEKIEEENSSAGTQPPTKSTLKRRRSSTPHIQLPPTPSTDSNHGPSPSPSNMLPSTVCSMDTANPMLPGSSLQPSSPPLLIGSNKSPPFAAQMPPPLPPSAWTNDGNQMLLNQDMSVSMPSSNATGSVQGGSQSSVNRTRGLSLSSTSPFLGPSSLLTVSSAQNPPFGQRKEYMSAHPENMSVNELSSLLEEDEEKRVNREKARDSGNVAGRKRKGSIDAGLSATGATSKKKPKTNSSSPKHSGTKVPKQEETLSSKKYGRGSGSKVFEIVELSIPMADAKSSFIQTNSKRAVKDLKGRIRIIKVLQGPYVDVPYRTIRISPQNGAILSPLSAEDVVTGMARVDLTHHYVQVSDALHSLRSQFNLASPSTRSPPRSSSVKEKAWQVFLKELQSQLEDVQPISANRDFGEVEVDAAISLLGLVSSGSKEGSSTPPFASPVRKGKMGILRAVSGSCLVRLIISSKDSEDEKTESGTDTDELIMLVLKGGVASEVPVEVQGMWLPFHTCCRLFNSYGVSTTKLYKIMDSTQPLEEYRDFKLPMIVHQKDEKYHRRSMSTDSESLHSEIVKKEIMPRQSLPQQQSTSDDSGFLVFDDDDDDMEGSQAGSEQESHHSSLDLVTGSSSPDSSAPPTVVDPTTLTLIPPIHPVAAGGQPLWITNIDGVFLCITWIHKSIPSLDPSSSAVNLFLEATPLLRRLDNGMVNATLLLHAGGITTDQERSIVLSLERYRVRTKKKDIRLQGTWVPLERAREMARTVCLDAKLSVFLQEGIESGVFGILKPLANSQKRRRMSSMAAGVGADGGSAPNVLYGSSLAGTSNQVLDGLKGMKANPSIIANGALSTLAEASVAISTTATPAVVSDTIRKLGLSTQPPVVTASPLPSATQTANIGSASASTSSTGSNPSAIPAPTAESATRLALAALASRLKGTQNTALNPAVIASALVALASGAKKITDATKIGNGASSASAATPVLAALSSTSGSSTSGGAPTPASILNAFANSLRNSVALAAAARQTAASKSPSPPPSLPPAFAAAETKVKMEENPPEPQIDAKNVTKKKVHFSSDSEGKPETTSSPSKKPKLKPEKSTKKSPKKSPKAPPTNPVVQNLARSSSVGPDSSDIEIDIEN
ncbi:hypothetical protein HDV05_008179 [Chytridiales sp. JEL 0842]|nr:hypothetical protein HDV05_008179 [Chytridiales sp. JEL 0842]